MAYYRIALIERSDTGRFATESKWFAWNMLLSSSIAILNHAKARACEIALYGCVAIFTASTLNL